MIGEIIPKNIGHTLDWMIQNTSKTKMLYFKNMEMVGFGLQEHHRCFLLEGTGKDISVKIKLKEEDKLFSRYIREKAKGVCDHCKKEKGVKKLQASHYFGRRNKALRWHEDNVSALCFTCHMVIMTENPHYHTRWMKKKLGTAGFNRLVRTSNRIRKWTKPDLLDLRNDLKEKLKQFED